MDEARKLHHNFVGTEHILLGLIRENEGVAARVFRFEYYKSTCTSSESIR